MDYLSKHRLGILILLIIIAAHFLLRLPNLTLQPIFADEAIYIRWAQVMRAEPTLRFLPLSDGKTPLFMWSLMPVLKFIEDPLFAGRFLSVTAGFVTLAGVFAVGWKVFGMRAAFWAALLYAVVPYTVFFDRMALVDSMLSAFTVWTVYFAVWLSQKIRLDLAMVLGYLLGGAILTKTSGMINILVLPISLISFKRMKNDRKYLVRLVIFWGVAIGITLLMYNILRLGPNFHLLSARNADYIFSPLELVGRPLDPFIPHFHDLSDWFPKLFTWPILVAVLVGIIWAVRVRNRGGLVVLLWALIPLLLSMTFLKTFTARYLLPSIPLLLIFAGYGMEKISNSKLQISNRIQKLILLVLVVLLPLKFNYELLTNPPPTSLPLAERKGYYEEWTAGYGFFEIAQFLKEKKREGKVVVGTEGSFGTLPDGLQIYLDKEGIPIVGSHATISAQIRNAAKDNQTYFVGNKNRVLGSIDNVILLKEYLKAKPLDSSKQDAIVFYEVRP